MNMGGTIVEMLKKQCANGANNAYCQKLASQNPNPANKIVPTSTPSRTTVDDHLSDGDQIAEHLDNLTSKYNGSPYQALRSGLGRVGDPTDLSYWYTYGMGPERKFFTDNTIPSQGSTTPATPTVSPNLPIGTLGITDPSLLASLIGKINPTVATDGRMQIPVTPKPVQAHALGGAVRYRRQGPLNLLRRPR